jgi:hypothetical protein
MTFTKVDKAASGGWRTVTDQPNVRMSCYLQDDKHPRSVAFYINQVLIDALGWKLHTDPNGRKSLHVDIHEGTGEDAGFLMLTEGDQRGYVLAVSKAGALTFAMNIAFVRFKHYAINEVPAPLGDVEFTYDANDKTILIQCPDWLRYNSLSVKAEPVKAEKEELPKLNRRDRRHIATKIASRLR